VKKPFKVMSAAGMIAVMASSTITPVMAAENPVSQGSIAEYAIIQNDQILKVSVNDYDEALMELEDKVTKVQVYITNTGKAYLVKDFDEALMEANGNVSDAIKMLAEDEESLELTYAQKDSYINDDGKFVYDEQPEDRLNETFFYNFAA